RVGGVAGRRRPGRGRGLGGRPCRAGLSGDVDGLVARWGFLPPDDARRLVTEDARLLVAHDAGRFLVGVARRRFCLSARLLGSPRFFRAPPCLVRSPRFFCLLACFFRSSCFFRPLACLLRSACFVRPLLCLLRSARFLRPLTRLLCGVRFFGSPTLLIRGTRCGRFAFPRLRRAARAVAEAGHGARKRRLRGVEIAGRQRPFAGGDGIDRLGVLVRGVAFGLGVGGRGAGRVGIGAEREHALTVFLASGGDGAREDRGRVLEELRGTCEGGGIGRTRIGGERAIRVGEQSDGTFLLIHRGARARDAGGGIGGGARPRTRRLGERALLVARTGGRLPRLPLACRAGGTRESLARAREPRRRLLEIAGGERPLGGVHGRDGFAMRPGRVARRGERLGIRARALGPLLLGDGGGTEPPSILLLDPPALALACGSVDRRAMTSCRGFEGLTRSAEVLGLEGGPAARGVVAGFAHDGRGQLFRVRRDGRCTRGRHLAARDVRGAARRRTPRDVRGLLVETARRIVRRRRVRVCAILHEGGRALFGGTRAIPDGGSVLGRPHLLRGCTGGCRRGARVLGGSPRPGVRGRARGTAVGRRRFAEEVLGLQELAVAQGGRRALLDAARLVEERPRERRRVGGGGALAGGVELRPRGVGGAALSLRLERADPAFELVVGHLVAGDRRRSPRQDLRRPVTGVEDGREASLELAED